MNLDISFNKQGKIYSNNAERIKKKEEDNGIALLRVTTRLKYVKSTDFQRYDISIEAIFKDMIYLLKQSRKKGLEM